MVIVIDTNHKYDDQPGSDRRSEAGRAAGRDLQDARRARGLRQGRSVDLEFQWVAKAIDIAHGAGIDKVGLMTAKVEAGQ